MQGNVGRKDAWIRAMMAVVFLVTAALFNHVLVLSLVAALLLFFFLRETYPETEVEAAAAAENRPSKT